MVGSRRGMLLALGFLVVHAGQADAFSCRRWQAYNWAAYSGPGAGCYGGGPMFMPRASTIQVRPVPRERAVDLAAPRAAPPSSNEPPLPGAPKKAPTITESRSLGGSYAGMDEPAQPDRCLVGFWNLSGRDVIIKINGEKRTIARDKAINLELERQFVWQVDRNEPTAEQVPTRQRRYEVMIRE